MSSAMPTSDPRKVAGRLSVSSFLKEEGTPTPYSRTRPPTTVNVPIAMGITTDQATGGIYWSLLADNLTAFYHYDYAGGGNGTILAGIAYDYAFPPWTRHYLLQNTNTQTGAAGNVYYWLNSPSQGSKTLPLSYQTLLAGTNISENAHYSTLTVFADSTATTQGWEIRFTGRNLNDLNP